MAKIFKHDQNCDQWPNIANMIIIVTSAVAKLFKHDHNCDQWPSPEQVQSARTLGFNILPIGFQVPSSLSLSSPSSSSLSSSSSSSPLNRELVNLSIMVSSIQRSLWTTLTRRSSGKLPSPRFSFQENTHRKYLVLMNPLICSLSLRPLVYCFKKSKHRRFDFQDCFIATIFQAESLLTRGLQQPKLRVYLFALLIFKTYLEAIDSISELHVRCRTYLIFRRGCHFYKNITKFAIAPQCYSIIGNVPSRTVESKNLKIRFDFLVDFLPKIVL